MGDLLSQILQVLVKILDKTHETPMASYSIIESDTAGAVKYYGNIDKFGRWYILKQDTGTGSYRYSSNSSDFATSWAIRATLTYDTYDKVFV